MWGLMKKKEIFKDHFKLLNPDRDEWSDYNFLYCRTIITDGNPIYRQYYKNLTYILKIRWKNESLFLGFRRSFLGIFLIMVCGKNFVIQDLYFSSRFPKLNTLLPRIYFVKYWSWPTSRFWTWENTDADYLSRRFFP